MGKSWIPDPESQRGGSCDSECAASTPLHAGESLDLLEATKCFLDLLTDELVVHCNGFISRISHHLRDRVANFYMIGSMGLASSIGLGLAVAQPRKRVVVFDGDGNLLMNLGTLGLIAAIAPPNLLHVVFDNEQYGSTGGQKCVSAEVALEKIALAAGYRSATSVNSREALIVEVPRFLKKTGPAMLLVKVAAGEFEEVPRVRPTPVEMATRFAKIARAD